MLDTPTNANLHDFNARYQGVIGWLQQDYGRTLVQIKSVKPDKVSFVDAWGKDYFAYVDKGVVFDFVPANRGFYASDTRVYFLSRIPARQWKRGMCPANTSISCLDDESGIFYNIEFDFEAISKIFLYPTGDVQTWNQVSMPVDKYVPTALSRVFAVAANNVFFYNQLVGHITKGVITLFSPIVQQELSDLIRRKNYALKVEV